MSKILNRLLGKSSSTDVASAIEKAKAELQAAEGAVIAADEKYQGSLLSEDAAALRRLADAKADAAITVDICAARIAKLESQHAEALEAEAADRRQVAYDQAKALADAARKKLATYEKAAMQIRDVLRTIAEADIAVDAANADLPDGAARIEKPEDCRSTPNLYKKVLKEETVDLWSAIGQQSVPVEHQHRVRVERVGKRIRSRYDDDGFDEGGYEKGYYATDGGGSIEVVKRRFIKRTFLPDDTGHFAAPLSQKVELPSAIVGGPTFFEAGNFTATRLLSELEKPLPPRQLRAERKPEIEFSLAPREAALAS